MEQALGSSGNWFGLTSKLGGTADVNFVRWTKNGTLHTTLNGGYCGSVRLLNFGQRLDTLFKALLALQLLMLTPSIVQTILRQ
jgi:hypothetical protein